MAMQSHAMVDPSALTPAIIAGSILGPMARHRWQKESRTRTPHLVNIVNNLRMPLVENAIDGQLSLYLGKSVPVAVVVVARVMMVELGWRGSLCRCSTGLFIPVGNNDPSHPD
jgi:hypothetical protein